jgi:hypothetical protein
MQHLQALRTSPLVLRRRINIALCGWRQEFLQSLLQAAANTVVFRQLTAMRTVIYLAKKSV